MIFGSLGLPKIRTSLSANKRPFSETDGSLSTSSETAGDRGRAATQRNELQSGLEAVGAPEITQSVLRTTYVCIDISNNKDFLKGCSQCESGKEYNEDYNAGQHLRRMHFNNHSKKHHGSIDPTEHRGEKGGGTEPPMFELRKWMKKIESRIEIPVAPSSSTTLQKHSERASSSISTTSNSDLIERSNSCCKCPKCETVFSGADRKSNLRRHIKTRHEDRRPFSCNHCSSQFLNQWNLKRHVAKHHDGISTQQDSPSVQGWNAKESDIPMSTAD